MGEEKSQHRLHELVEICQFKSNVLPGIDEHWLCRFTDCRLIVMPEDWVNNVANGRMFLDAKVG